MPPESVEICPFNRYNRKFPGNFLIPFLLARKLLLKYLRGDTTPPHKHYFIGDKMTSIKNYTIGFVFAVSFLVVANVRAEMLTKDFGINIIDDKNGDVGFYKMFNKQFGTAYLSSNDIYNALGVDPTSNWIVSEDSKLVGGDKNQSGFAGELSMYNNSGAFNSIATAQTVLADKTIGLGINYAIDSNVYVTGSGVGFQLDVDRNVGYESQNWTLQVCTIRSMEAILIRFTCSCGKTGNITRQSDGAVQVLRNRTLTGIFRTLFTS